tara:strand:- start:88 stop:309 length:222 start_codon:yes stop_codon:yes gene_type:complete
MNGKTIPDTINDLIDQRLEAEREILYTYYKRCKYMCNEDARGAVSSHFTVTPNKAYEVIKETTKHWNNLNNER